MEIEWCLEERRFSFGCADAALIVSKDPALADAAATALGNAVQPDVPLEDCFNAIDKSGIDGALVIRGEEMAVWGGAAADTKRTDMSGEKRA